MDLSIKNLLYWSYWFSQPYIARGWEKLVWFGVFLALLLLGVVFQTIKFYQRDHLKKEVLRRLSNLTLTLGCLGLLWMFFRQERVVFLAWRFWLWGWVVLGLVWFCKIVHYIIKRTPVIRAEQKERERKEKYLPKSKR